MDAVGARLAAHQAERQAGKDRRKAEAALLADPAESVNVYWQEFNASKAEVTRTIEEAEALATQDSGADAAATGEAAAKAAALFCQASMMVAAMQEKVARATLFLPGYDQRLANDAVTAMHGAVADAKRRVFPASSFKFKTRKSVPVSLASLIAEVRREVGTTAGLRLQGDTKAEELDPDLVFVDRKGETLVKHTGEIFGRDLVLSRLTDCTVYVCDPCGAVRADRLQNCKVHRAPALCPRSPAPCRNQRRSPIPQPTFLPAARRSIWGPCGPSSPRSSTPARSRSPRSSSACTPPRCIVSLPGAPSVSLHGFRAVVMQCSLPLSPRPLRAPPAPRRLPTPVHAALTGARECSKQPSLLPSPTAVCCPPR